MRTRLILHHSADASDLPQFEKINGYHRSKGFPISSLGFYGGYHWLCGKDGTLKQYRGIDEYGAHTAAMCDDGHCNLVAWGVCLAGDLTWQTPTDAQLASLYTLWKALNYPKLILHSDVKKTDCPGDFDFRNEMTRRWLMDLRQQLKNALHALGRFVGKPRWNMLTRKISRIRKTKGVQEGE